MNSIYPWQKKQWQQLTQQYEAGRLPYALLLDGIEGVGKADFALAFASFLLCESQTNKMACGQCKSCKMFEAASHPDFISVGLEEKAKNIKVAQVRSLCEALQKTAQYQGFQVVIINPADKMNRASANALLKTLEEPAGQVLIILITSQRHQ